MRFTILKQVLLLCCVPLAGQLALITLLATAQHDTQQAEAWSLHSKEVLAQQHAVASAVVESEAAIHGWVLSEPQSAERYARARREIPALLERLQALVEDNPAQTSRAEAIARQARTLLESQAEIAELLRAGRRELAGRQLATGQSRRATDRLRELWGDFLAAEQALDAVRLQTATAMRRRLNGFLAGGAALAIGLTSTLMLLVARGIGRRVAVIMRNTQRISQGRPLEPPVGGGDEIARLDCVFHEMAAALARAAEQERAYTATLERRVSERTRELEATNRVLSHKNDENEAFVYTVSHDLRSPLVNLQGFSRELSYTCAGLQGEVQALDLPADKRQQLLKLVDHDMAESIEFIRTAVGRLSTIIDALLRLSRVGRVQYQWQPVDVDATVRRVAAALRCTAAARQATIIIHQLPTAWGDPTAIEQIFANLIANALNYLNPARPGLIEVGIAEAGEPGMNTYYVRDNGLGIATEYQPKLFRAFQRLHRDRAPGEGMGLAMVSRIVARHHGRIWVHSAEDAGSTFFVSLAASGETGPPINESGAECAAPAAAGPICICAG